MTLPKNKTKIVCTIGPASESREMLEQMILAGMNIARVNFSHGDFPGHKKIIENVRAAAHATGRRVAIMADLPGPKMRIGQIAEEPIELEAGTAFTLTSEDIVGDRERVSMTFDRLPQAVHPVDRLFLNDGLIQLLTTFAAKLIPGNVLISTPGANRGELCPALPTKLPFIGIFTLTFWALHLRWPPSPLLTKSPSLYPRERASRGLNFCRAQLAATASKRGKPILARSKDKVNLLRPSASELTSPDDLT